MELLVHGHGGARGAGFPTSQGRFYEWEDQGMCTVTGASLGAYRADAGWYDAVRRLDIILAIGRDDAHYEDNVRLWNVVWSRGIRHAFRPWDGWAHDWPWWQQMIQQYIGGEA